MAAAIRHKATCHQLDAAQRRNAAAAAYLTNKAPYLDYVNALRQGWPIAYIHADLSIKERALALTTPASIKPGRYKPADPILAFLERL